MMKVCTATAVRVILFFVLNHAMQEVKNTSFLRAGGNDLFLTSSIHRPRNSYVIPSEIFKYVIVVFCIPANLTVLLQNGGFCNGCITIQILLLQAFPS
jgi:hypothetical protein